MRELGACTRSRLSHVLVGLSVWKVYCGKTADSIRMPFGVVSGVGRRMGVLDGDGDRRRERAVLGVNAVVMGGDAAHPKLHVLWYFFYSLHANHASSYCIDRWSSRRLPLYFSGDGGAPFILGSVDRVYVFVIDLPRACNAVLFFVPLLGNCVYRTIKACSVYINYCQSIERRWMMMCVQFIRDKCAIHAVRDVVWNNTTQVWRLSLSLAAAAAAAACACVRVVMHSAATVITRPFVRSKI